MTEPPTPPRIERRTRGALEDGLSIRVRWFSTLIKRTRSGQAQTVVEWRVDTTPKSIFLDEGFNDADAEHVIAAINGERADIDTALNDGDELEFLVGISGG